MQIDEQYTTLISELKYQKKYVRVLYQKIENYLIEKKQDKRMLYHFFKLWYKQSACLIDNKKENYKSLDYQIQQYKRLNDLFLMFIKMRHDDENSYLNRYPKEIKLNIVKLFNFIPVREKNIIDSFTQTIEPTEIRIPNETTASNNHNNRRKRKWTKII
tara:strand:+ start:79 stop:555 length:477 start_codon:yes stop_codon:yes gene_type:complete